MKEYIAEYFFKTKKILEAKKPNNVITMQFFQREDNTVLCGMKEVLELLEKETDTKKYKIRYLPDGSIINDKEVVLELEGHYQDFGIYEGMIDGILARSSSIATNTRRIVEVANGKKIVYMGDRADHYLMQRFDGYAVHIGGVDTQCTKEHVALHNGLAVGTVPHVLFQGFDGDIVKALQAYKEVINEPITALVDFNNDVINDSLKALKVFGKDMVALRVDTAQNVRDKMFKNNEDEFGVTPNQIKRLRQALDEHNGKHVKIIVSSGFNAKKVKWFEDEKTPVDVYGIGGSILKIKLNFSADAVKLNGKEIAKFGRVYSHNPKLIEYKKSSK
ncbi:nicotinic acid phosphoribosyltransferase [Mycoplasmopsis californica]|uniref:nicotinate phosphoribosyltransferase n=1 Tax=Mycoplasmopsis equigenitalium TaxID=114883 RepID=A0ABY5J105_9BACT|nr:nicotinate phosphoribosyltransferase [Mycoplasmopsis equigenitalium]UUD36935.1 nicotinate phosphoribosyltransferase [Mycoplasmopsis equigenitalium]VEU69770.1 nicotinic acid phosphoribosyltransferase [Mycoplasmopsis californica]